MENYPDEMFEEAERREREVQENMKRAVELDQEIEEAERRERSNRVLQRYNDFHNLETSGLPHGTPITPEHQQIIAFESMIDALRCEHLNREYTHIAINDIEDLIERLQEQSNEYIKKVAELNGKFWEVE